MGPFMTVGFIMLAVLGLAPEARAVPSFTWIDPWNVTLLPNCSIGGICGGNPRAFGASATFDGQIVDTVSDTAVAKSAWRTSAGTFGSGSTGLTFSRHFLLSGSPQGWNVSLGGLLMGSVGAGGQFANASVTARAAISPGPSLLEWHEERVNSLPEFATVNQAKDQTTALADGLYTVTGSLSTLAGFSGCACVAFSNFFAGLDAPVGSFQVNVAASPVPEPSSFLLLATGLFGVAWARRNWSAWLAKRAEACR